MGRRTTGLLISAALAVSLVVVAPVSPASAVTGPVVPASQFGMTINSLAGTTPVPRGYGSVRLWDVGVSWADLQPTPSQINWAPLDLAVSRARAAGITDILYVLGSTPRWARIPSWRESADLPYPGRASHPAKDSYYLNFLRALLLRYKGKITSYEIWNEANLPSFYRGTPTQLARLTLEAYRLIKSISPSVTVVSPSWLLRYWTTPREQQLAALKAVGWPVDVVAVHGYPFSVQGPDDRVRYLLGFRSRLTAYGAARKPIWDTEVNFGDRRPGYPYRSYTGAYAARLAARAYLDSLRYGIARTYWYSWDTHILGIDLVDSHGAPTPAAKAILVLRGWTAGLRWLGCTTASNGINRCGLVTWKGARRSIVYTSGRAVRMLVPAHALAACTLDGACRPVRPGTAFYLTSTPLYLVGA